MPTALDWTHVRTERVDYEAGAILFSQGDPATTVMCIQRGDVRLSVLSHTGKEAVVGVLTVGDFLGESLLAGRATRMETATAMGPCTALIVAQPEMLRQIHARSALTNALLDHVLKRSIRFEEDLVDHLFNPGEQRLARTLLLLARDGGGDTFHRAVPPMSQELLAEMVGTTRARVNVFMNRFRRRGFIDYTSTGSVTVHRSLASVVLHG